MHVVKSSRFNLCLAKKNLIFILFPYYFFVCAIKTNLHQIKTLPFFGREGVSKIYSIIIALVMLIVLLLYKVFDIVLKLHLYNLEMNQQIPYVECYSVLNLKKENFVKIIQKFLACTSTLTDPKTANLHKRTYRSINLLLIAHVGKNNEKKSNVISA